jgi:ABC-type transport system involved in cytochrome bd biosynthesis fused ATPase/permease subunit
MERTQKGVMMVLFVCCFVADKFSLCSFNLFHLRQHIGLVSQEPQLFDLSITENIRFGKLDATEEEIIDVSCSQYKFHYLCVDCSKIGSQKGQRIQFHPSFA